MKTLLLLRHAKPENAVGGLSDFDRALNDRGRREAQAVGKYIQQQKLKLDLLLSSPALRARETTELLISAGGLHGGLRFDQRIYEASSSQLLSLLSEVEAATLSLMLVGHNPGVVDLLEVLTGRTEGMAPATLAKIDLKADKWSTVSAGDGKLDWLVNPNDLAAT